MAVVTRYVDLSTKGNAHVIDVTGRIAEHVLDSKVVDGIVTVSVIGSTGAMTTIEYEPGLQKDVGEVFDQWIPPGQYHHDQTWGDGNGHSHLRASVVGPSVTLPFSHQKLILGTWQQIVFIDFDARPRDRRLVVQIMGE